MNQNNYDRNGFSPGGAMTIIIYTDGGCNPNPGPGGWGALLLMPDNTELELSGSDTDTTNNRMELTAAIKALEAIPAHSHVALYTDSQYLRKGITEWMANWKQQGWKKRDGKDVLNRDLWESLNAAIQRHSITWHWVKGHANNAYNERVDQLASAAIPRQPQQSDPDATRIYLRVSVVGSLGGWAAYIKDKKSSFTSQGKRSATTSNRLELECAIEAIQLTSEGQLVEIYTASDYLYKGITQWIEGWQRRGWQTSTGAPVKNADLWQKVLTLSQQRNISWKWVRKGNEPDEFRALHKTAVEARQA